MMRRESGVLEKLLVCDAILELFCAWLAGKERGPFAIVFDQVVCELEPLRFVLKANEWNLEAEGNEAYSLEQRHICPSSHNVCQLPCCDQRWV